MSEDIQEESFEDAFNSIVDEEEGTTSEIDDEAVLPDETEGEPEAADAEDGEPEVEDGSSETDAGVEPDQGEAEEPELDEVAKLREEAQKWQHRYNSDLGRQNALQRKIQEQQQYINQLKQPQGENPDGSGMSDKEWKTLQEDFPEIAAGIESRISNIVAQYEQKLSTIEQKFEPLEQQNQAQYRNAQFQILETEHPDWRDVAGTNEFREWISQQPAIVQQMVQSEEAAEAAYLMRQYKLSNQTVASTNDVLKQKRQRQLQQGKTLSSRGGRKTSALPPEDDYEAAFNYFAER